MVSQPNRTYWTVDEYLAYEHEEGVRYEYIDGQIYMMSGGTRRHNRIAVNCTSTLNIQLESKPCEVYNSDMRTKINDMKYLYPDFSIACRNKIFSDEKETMLENPVIVAEVLSDYRRGEKANHYRSLPSLKAYLILDPNKVYARLYTRHDEGWLLREYQSLTNVIPLDATDCELNLDVVYRDIEFETDTDE